jgi:hypothetical protein
MEYLAAKCYTKIQLEATRSQDQIFTKGDKKSDPTLISVFEKQRAGYLLDKSLEAGLPVRILEL